MEVALEIYKFIRENKNRVFIGHLIHDLININPYLSYGRFNHNIYKCNNDLYALNAMKITAWVSSIVITEYVNCYYNNKKYRINLPTDHLPTEKMKCSIFKNKIKKYINSLDYPITPILPTWDGTSASNIIHNYQKN